MNITTRWARQTRAHAPARDVASLARRRRHVSSRFSRRRRSLTYAIAMLMTTTATKFVLRDIRRCVSVPALSAARPPAMCTMTQSA